MSLPRLWPRRKPIRRRVGVAKRSTKRGGVEKADREWSKAVAERDGGCVLAYLLPYHDGPMDSHHIYGKKAHPQLRHDVKNGVRVCRAAHDWAHANGDEFKAWFAEAYPERWAYLQERAR